MKGILKIIRVGGNSYGVIIPKIICDNFALQPGDQVKANFEESGVALIDLKKSTK